MSADLMGVDIVDDAADFFAPAATGAVDLLLAQHDGLRRQIAEIASFIGERLDGGAIDYFLEGNRSEDRGRTSLERSARQLFDEAGAAKALDAAFWSKALALTDVLDAMPQKRRNEWHEAIMRHDVPPFDDKTVRDTLAALLADRSKFFAERVDGIFRGLSGEHVTNSPAAFGKRMIVAHMLTFYDTVDHNRAGLINDLRAVIAKFMGRDEPRHDSTQPLIQRLRGRWGEWVPIDGGALRIRLYKKGTAHLEVHPDMAWRLNQVLASIYPLAIPPEFRTKPKRRVREFELIRRPLPFQVVDALANLEEAQRRVPEAERHSWRDEGWRRMPNTRRFKYGAAVKDGLQEAEQVLASIGGVKQPDGYWLFDYEPGEVLSEIVVTGCLPDRRSHQFYPTPQWLAEQLVEAASVDPAHLVLEPSAGMGGLADLLPKSGTVCVEVSPLHCAILKAKGFNTVEDDFLVWAEQQLQSIVRFDRVVMNPPFSEGRWQVHLQAAAAMVKPGGKLAAILPNSAKTQAAELLPGMAVECHGQFDDAFPGASVSVVLVTATRKDC